MVNFETSENSRLTATVSVKVRTKKTPPLLR